jgi:hypothetical protein
MKLKAEPLSKYFKPVKLFRDDLKAIYDVATEHADKIRITTEKFEFNDWQDFIDNTKSIKTLELYTYSSSSAISIRVKINKTSTYLDCSWGDEVASSHAFLRLSNIIKNLEIDPPYLFRIPFFITYSIILILWGFTAKNYLTTSYYWLGYTISFMLVCICMYFVFPKSKILLNLREDNPSFVQKNKDAIIVGVILVIVTAIITTIINHIGSPSK